MEHEIKTIRTELDKKLDIFVAYFNEDIINPIEVIPGPFDGSVLFEVDSITNELMKVTIYNFKAVRRELKKQMIFILTKNALKNWINSLANSFSSNNTQKLAYS